MILEIGVDCVNKKSLEKFEESFFERTFSKKEIEEAKEHSDISMYYAERFAVKEAVFKALNTIIDGYEDLREVETINDSSGKPVARFYNKLSKYNDVYKIKVSITSEDDYAIAMIVITQK